MSIIIIPENSGPCDHTCVVSLIITFSSLFGLILLVGVFFCCCICIIPEINWRIQENNDMNDEVIRRNVISFILSNEPDTDIELYRKFNTYINQRQLKGCSFDTFCKIKDNHVIPEKDFVETL